MSLPVTHWQVFLKERLSKVTIKNNRYHFETPRYKFEVINQKTHEQTRNTVLVYEKK